jgi:hypothetical protein
MAMLFKERIANIPDNIEDKEIISYAKNIIKEIKEENKKKKVEDAEKIKKKRVAKKMVAKNLDEDGNEIPKKLNKYQQYMKDNQQRIKEENPGLSNTERFAKLAEEWNEYKKANIKDEKTDESESEKEVRDEDEVKENKKKRGKKNA